MGILELRISDGLDYYKNGDLSKEQALKGIIKLVSEHTKDERKFAVNMVWQECFDSSLDFTDEQLNFINTLVTR